jgi:acyl carrier protein
MANHRETMLPDSVWHDKLLQLWRKVLKTEDVSLDDDFFEKGGDSLLAIDLQLELQRMTGRELPESILFEASTVRALVDRLSRQAAAAR